ncbi:Chromosome transmission fidelity protein 8 [Nakaseomyces bracarensis]|uniref:Chromosome transmission fidelity protein 8 n=1 Tax=Nakaseomyces bracarensis TaxID=273131 RepID=A0ABR4NMV8_9SACH
MPSVPISYDTLRLAQCGDEVDEQERTIETPLGRMIVEIQGSLELPSDIDSSSELYKSVDGHDTVQFGNLTLEDNNKAILFVGKKQRLLGKVVKLNPPVGLLKFNDNGQNVELLDIIEYKVLFSDRPLPIM